MAIAAFKMKDFQTAHELQIFVSTGAVTAVVAIVFNTASGKYTLFYT